MYFIHNSQSPAEIRKGELQHENAIGTDFVWTRINTLLWQLAVGSSNTAQI